MKVYWTVGQVSKKTNQFRRQLLDDFKRKISNIRNWGFKNKPRRNTEDEETT